MSIASLHSVPKAAAAAAAAAALLQSTPAPAPPALRLVLSRRPYLDYLLTSAWLLSVLMVSVLIHTRLHPYRMRKDGVAKPGSKTKAK